MKRFVLLLFACGTLTGCVRYDMTLTNGGHITNVTRPKFDNANGVYTYKDVAGNQRVISAGRVVQIQPHSAKNDNGFNAP